MKLENAITVTNNWDYRSPSDRPIDVVYVLGPKACEEDLLQVREAVLQQWRWLAQVVAPRGHAYSKHSLGSPMAGLHRGVLSSLFLKSGSLLLSKQDLDDLYFKGLNPVRFMPGYGYIIWGDRYRSYGSPVDANWSTRFDSDTPIGVASVGTLRRHGVEI